MLQLYFISFSRVVVIILQYFCFLCLTAQSQATSLSQLARSIIQNVQLRWVGQRKGAKAGQAGFVITYNMFGW